MVLENASDSTVTDSFTENPPASDDDPYSSSTPKAGTENYRIDTSSLPKPIPILGPLLGYNEKLFLAVLQGKIQNGTNALKRPPTQDEANAYAYWTAKQISILSYGAPLGIGAGWWRAYSTAGTFRFPFWQPNLETFQPEILPPKLGSFKGNRAVAAWHAMRMLAYGGVGNYIGQILFGSYSMSVAAVGELSDPRLKSMVEAVRQQAQQRRGSLPSPRQPAAVDAQQRGETRVGRGPQADDASPTGGNYTEESTGFGGNVDTTDDEGQKVQWPQARRHTPGPISQTGPQDQPFDPFDDASATTGLDARAESTPPQQQGSAWDRVRRGASKGPAPGQRQEPSNQSAWSQQNRKQREQGEDSTAGNSFAFSKSEEERNLAKEEAQKEFDARVEQERRGGDFSSDQKRW